LSARVKARVQAFAEGEAAGRDLAEALGVPFGLVESHRFPDGEVLPTTPTTADMLVVYRSLDAPNDKLVELVLACESWRRMGARRLVLVAPYLAYMRQDRAFEPGQAISQRAVAGLISRYFDRLVTVNPHLHRIRGLGEVFGDTPAQALDAGASIGDWLKAEDGAKDAILMGPDEESGPLVQAAAGRLGASWTVLAKTRRGDRRVELEPLNPEPLRGRRVVLVDDICSSGTTLIEAARRVLEAGAREVRAVIVHALFDEATEARLKAAGIAEIASTDSVAHPTNRIRLAPLLAGALTGELSA
jgi:ribose-phosphate pyrophosphokinase